MNNPILDQKTLDLILTNKTARLDLVTKSHKAFFATYFPHYLEYPSADIHHELFDITQDPGNKFAIILTFRGSGKSTIVSLSYALWAILGFQQKHFVVLVTKTQDQAKKLIDAIKREFETNKLLQNDFGKVHEESSPWNSTALTFANQTAQITAISIDQAMRGMRFQNFRPDLIILDDIEDSASVRTVASRDRLEEWLEKDLLPAGDVNTRTILVGNNLHPDSLPSRLINKVQAGQFDARVVKCPLVDENGNCAWLGKFPTKEKLNEFRNSFPSDRTWRQEFLLQPVLSDEQVVEEKHIQFYDKIKTNRGGYDHAAIGIDLACSTSPKADKTAMVSARVVGCGDKMKIYILPSIVNSRLEIHNSLNECLLLMKRIDPNGHDGKRDVRVYVESVGFQKTFVQQLMSRNVRRVEEFYPNSMGDKRERLFVASDLIKSGQVLFPRVGAEELIQQLIYFGIERYDDLVDAFTTLVAKAIENNPKHRTFGVAVGNMNEIMTAEQLRQERESQRLEQEVHMQAWDYQIYLNELHKQGKVPDLHTSPNLNHDDEIEDDVGDYKEVDSAETNDE